jgi:hypothetical protein
MGIYNYRFIELPSPLNNNKCFICDQEIQPFNKNPELDAFQYKCNNCNSRLIIEISGSLLASSIYDKLRSKKLAREAIQGKIKVSSDNRFAITTSFASEYI